MKCRYCNHEIDSTDHFCMYCGHKAEAFYYSDQKQLSTEFTVESAKKLVQEMNSIYAKLNHIKNDMELNKSEVVLAFRNLVRLRFDVEKELARKINFMNMQEVDSATMNQKNIEDARHLMYLTCQEIQPFLKENSCTEALKVKKYMNACMDEVLQNLKADDITFKYVQNSYWHIQFEKVEPELKKWLDNYKNIYSHEVSVLRRVRSNFKWNHMRKDQRDQTIEIYAHLIKVLNEFYLNEESLELQPVSVFEKLIQNPKDVLENLYIEGDVPFDLAKFCVDISDLESLLMSYDACTYDFATNQQKLKENIYQLSKQTVEENMDEQLHQTSVEKILEIQKNYDIHVSPLKDHGYNTIADIIDFDVDQLHAIEGIDFDSACCIAGTVKSIVRNLESENKITLNYDQKDERSSKLVKNLYEYIILCQAEEQILALGSEENSQLDSAAMNVQTLSHLFWRFSSDFHTEWVEESLDCMDRLLYGPLGKKRKEIIQSIVDVDYCDAWEKFKENPNDFYTTLQTLVPDWVNVISNEKNPIE